MDKAQSKARVDHGLNLGSEGRIHPIRPGGNGFGVRRDLDLEGNNRTAAKIRLVGGESVSILEKDGGERVYDTRSPPRTL